MTAPLPPPGTTDRMRLRRLPERAVSRRAELNEILDRALVAHVAVVDDGQPYALPVACGRDGDRLLLHGSTGSRLFRRIGDGAPVCVTVTLLDGLVLARSLFESSMNYRSVLAIGSCAVLTGPAKLAALERLSEHLMPQRWAQARQPSPKELAATSVLALPLDECSVKVRTGGPEDPPEDVALPVWAGVVPLLRAWGEPVPADDLAAGLPPPAYLDEWFAGRS